MDETLKRDSTVKALEKLSKYTIGEHYSISEFKIVSDIERDLLFCFLEYFGVIIIDNHSFFIPSQSASFFLISLGEYVKNGISLISVWDNKDSTVKSSSINEETALLSYNFLYLMEKQRKMQCKAESFVPIKKETLVRVVFKRKLWWTENILMQYDHMVHDYQLIGGIVKQQDNSLKVAVNRKIQEELPEMSLSRDNYTLEEVFVSELDEEEMFFSKKFGVFVKYKSYIFQINLQNAIDGDLLKKINNNKDNHWVSMHDIEKGKAKDRRSIFPIQARAIEKIKKIPVNVTVRQYDISYILSSKYFQMLVAVSTLLGVGLAGLLDNVFSWIKNILGLE